MNCIFCKIIAGEIPAAIVHHDEHVTAFRDIHPSAPTHILIVPNKHIESINQAEPQDTGTLGQMFITARQLAAQEGLSAAGYRLIINTGADGGQTIFHLHMHLMGGRTLRSMG